MKTVLLSLFVWFAAGSPPATFARVYLDADKNVHAVDAATGNDIALTTRGRYARPKLSRNGETAAWLVTRRLKHSGETTTVATHAETLRLGRTRRIECVGLVRDFALSADGKYIALDCGGMHFAGTDVLFEIATGRQLAVSLQATVPWSERPSWALEDDFAYTPPD